MAEEHEKTCPTCFGTGRIRCFFCEEHSQECEICGGTGMMDEKWLIMPTLCPQCQGGGIISPNCVCKGKGIITCWHCGGVGKVKSHTT